MTIVQLGVLGDVKKMMKVIGKRDSHVDMEFIVGQQAEIFKCHRFIIGAQSR